MHIPTLAGFTLVATLAIPVAYAQQPTDDEQDDTIQSTAAAPPQERGGRGFIEDAKRWAEDVQIVERLTGEVDGWYPRLGRMTRGSGFALGPGYRAHVFGDRILFDLSAGMSIKGYKSADANVRWLQAFDDRVEVWTDFRYEDFPQEDFFGVGLATREDMRTSYDFDSREIALRGLVKPVSSLRVGTILGYLSPEIGPGTDDKYPSIEQLFSDASAPGLAAQPDFLHTTFFGEVDTRDYRGNPGSGGFYRASFGVWDDRSLQQFDFRRFDVLLAQYVPLVASKTHVVSGRFGTSYVNNETGERVPFYFLPYVGGVDTIRSFREFRFKDENALWMSAEYKWTLHKYVSVVGFADAGEVREDWQDIDLTGLETGYGFGVLAHTRKYTFARLDFGTGGGEGWQVFIKMGPRF